MLVTCPHLDDDRCRLAAEVSGEPVESCPVSSTTCEACLARGEPGPGNVSIRVAIVAIRACERAGHREKADALRAEFFHSEPVSRSNRTAPPPAGPGTELKALLTDMGLNAIGGCGCEAKAADMDRWGIAGCREHRAEIVTWLEQSREKAGWGATLAAAVHAIQRPWFRVFDPLGSIVDEAIRRAAARGD